MESVLDVSLKDAAMLGVNQRLILQSIDWDFYERVLKRYESSNELHFAYNDGILEVEVPRFEHERPTQILRDLISTICVEREIDCLNAGSTTFRKREKAKGVEPDTCFYIQNEGRIRGLRDIDLSRDPPPDLVIEVDVSSPSLDKMPIYAALGVTEVWLYKGHNVIFHELSAGEYRQIRNSRALPFLDSETANLFLLRGFSERFLDWTRNVREWASRDE